jgi:hypothetical protein
MGDDVSRVTKGINATVVSKETMAFKVIVATM